MTSSTYELGTSGAVPHALLCAQMAVSTAPSVPTRRGHTRERGREGQGPIVAGQQPICRFVGKDLVVRLRLLEDRGPGFQSCWVATRGRG
jgi:hypothetical protein